MSTFGGLDTLFNPAKRHLDEERLRLQSTREDIGDASGGKRIDLDSGRVKIARSQSTEDVLELAGDDPADDSDAPTVATTAGTVRTDADADADPAAAAAATAAAAAAADHAAAATATADSGVTATAARHGKAAGRAKDATAKHGTAKHGTAKHGTAADDEDTPAARARRRRATKA